ncbi:hypothetical protein FSP39_014894 [Pinctada imbricata]|uniref:Uncharacterized protein n=1 Tax=Pinctada imbricata TaxID=66713 RepID=A0AA88Y166_PINIB|nr:hypothetical protein FSP39_014894 [Pinctada imbricata]
MRHKRPHAVINQRYQLAKMKYSLKQRKLAIALAIISSKPDGMTGEQYASKLCTMYQTSQLQWKERCERAQHKILHLQQELVLQTLQGHDQTGFPDDSQTSVDLLFTTPSSESYSKADTTVTESLEYHTNFLQSLLNLRQITNCTGAITPTILVTITNSIASVCHCLQEKDSLSDFALRACFQHMNCLVDRSEVFSSEETLLQIQQLGTTLVEKVLNHRTKKMRQTLVGACSEISHSILLCSVMRPLLDKVEMFSEHLRQVSQNGICLDVDLYDRMPSLFNLGETIFLGLQKNNQAKEEDFLEEIYSRLDNSLLYVSDKFPLYAHAIWKLQGMMEHCSPRLR